MQWVKDADFGREVYGSTTPVLLLVVDDAGSAQKLLELAQSVRRALESQYKLVAGNARQLPRSIKPLLIESYPTLLLFERGLEVTRWEGLAPTPENLRVLKRLLPDPSPRMPESLAPQNAIQVLTPYRHGGTWVFDDERTGLVQEPFVCGIPIMIDSLVETIPNADQGFRLLFSVHPFPGSQRKLSWLRPEAGGNWYRADEPALDGWLCPALFKYFEQAPAELYVRAEPLMDGRTSSAQESQPVKELEHVCHR